MPEMTSRVISWCETTIARHDTIKAEPERTISHRRNNFSAIATQIARDAARVARDGVRAARDGVQIAKDGATATGDAIAAAMAKMVVKMASITRARIHNFNKYDAICFAK